MPELNIEPHICKGKNHSSICDKITTTVLTTSSCSVTCPVVLIEIEVVKCLALVGNLNRSKENRYFNEYKYKKNTRKTKIYSVKIERN